MKKICFITITSLIFISCGLFKKANKNGCPSNGKNIGAEKLVIADPKAEKLAKDAPKYKQDKKILDN